MKTKAEGFKAIARDKLGGCGVGLGASVLLHSLYMSGMSHARELGCVYGTYERLGGKVGKRRFGDLSSALWDEVMAVHEEWIMVRPLSSRRVLGARA